MGSADLARSDPLLEAEGLTLERGGRVLFEGLSLRVGAGEVVQVEGANGAGKTSLLRILAGLSRHGFEGRVRRAAPPLYLGHQSAVKGLLSPRENLAWHLAGEACHEGARIEWALARVGLYGYEDLPSHMLSAGQQRRVNLARLYLSGAPLWLLDEPFTAIDREGVAQLETHLAERAAAGVAIVLTSHQPLSAACPARRFSLDRGARP